MTNSNLGKMRSKESIEKAMRLIRDWLLKINVNGMSINTNFDARTNIALVKFRYKDKDYEFRSTRQDNCRLNMFAIARVMEYKVRASIMGIEDFEKSMIAYVQLEDKSGIQNDFSIRPVNEVNYLNLGLSTLASNDEIKEKYKELVRSFHPDLAGSELAKKEFEKRLSSINEAYSVIKKERGI